MLKLSYDGSVSSFISIIPPGSQNNTISLTTPSRILSAVVNQPCPITQDEDTGHGNLAGHVTYDNAFRHRIYKGGSPKPLALSKSETNGLLTAWLLFGDYVTESSAAEV